MIDVSGVKVVRGIRFNKRSLLLFVIRFIIPGRQAREARGDGVYRLLFNVCWAQRTTAGDVGTLFGERASWEDVGRTLGGRPQTQTRVKIGCGLISDRRNAADSSSWLKLTKNGIFDPVFDAAVSSRMENRLNILLTGFLLMKAPRGSSNYTWRISAGLRLLLGDGRRRTAGGSRGEKPPRLTGSWMSYRPTAAR